MAIWDVFEPVTFLVFGIIFCLAYYLLFPKKLPPGPIAFPIVGNLLQLPKDVRKLTDVFDRYAQKYGNIFRLYFGNQLIIILHGYDAVHQALVTQKASFSDRPKLWVFEQAGTAILLSSGQKWKDVRRLTLKAMRDFGVGKTSLEEKIQDEANAIMRILSENEGKPFTLNNYLPMATSNIICSIIFGSRFEYEDPRFQKLMVLLEEMFKRSFLLNPGNMDPLFRLLPSIRKDLHEDLHVLRSIQQFSKELVKEHQLTYDKNNIRDFTDMYIQYMEEEDGGSSFDENTFLNILVELFLAGTETTSTTVNWGLLYMMAYPDVQARCQEEIDQVVGRGRMLKYTDRAHLPFVEATICEILRFSAIAVFAVPHANVDDAELMGFSIPKGSIVLPYLRSVHKDPKYWDQPDEFRPERFLNSEGKVIKKEGFLVFSAGPRVCTGESLAKQELFLIFGNLLQRFTFKPPDGVKVRMESCHGLTYTPLPYEIVATKR